MATIRTPRRLIGEMAARLALGAPRGRLIRQLAAEALLLAKGAHAVVLDGLRPEEHPTHMNIAQAIEAAHQIGAPVTYLTHLTHAIDHGPFEAALPAGIRLAYDGLKLTM